MLELSNKLDDWDYHRFDNISKTIIQRAFWFVLYSMIWGFFSNLFEYQKDIICFCYTAYSDSNIVEKYIHYIYLIDVKKNQWSLKFVESHKLPRTSCLNKIAVSITMNWTGLSNWLVCECAGRTLDTAKSVLVRLLFLKSLLSCP